MSGVRRGVPETIAHLLRELSAPKNDEAVLDRIPGGWALNENAYEVIHAAVPFSGTVNATELPEAIRAATRSRRTDLAGVAWVLHCLAPQGRAALLVPESFLAEATQGHMRLRRRLTEEGRLHGILRLAPGIYRSRSAAAILLLDAAEAGPVWLCDVAEPSALQPGADGSARSALASRWFDRDRERSDVARAGPSFFVGREEIAAAQFDLSVERYRSAARSVPVRAPHEILAELAGLEAEIFQGIRDLVGHLKR